MIFHAKSSRVAREFSERSHTREPDFFFVFSFFFYRRCLARDLRCSRNQAEKYRDKLD